MLKETSYLQSLLCLEIKAKGKDCSIGMSLTPFSIILACLYLQLPGQLRNPA